MLYQHDLRRLELFFITDFGFALPSSMSGTVIRADLVDYIFLRLKQDTSANFVLSLSIINNVTMIGLRS